MPYEVFDRKNQRSREPSVTFMKIGRFAFNKAATSIFKERKLNFINLAWDKEKRLVGFQPVACRDELSYRIRYNKRGDACGFSAITFMRHIEYDRSKSHSYSLEWDEKEKMFIAKVSLKKD